VHALGKDKKSRLEQITAAINSGQLALVMDDAQPLLEQLAREGGAAAIAQLGLDDEGITDQANQFAIDYAAERSAEMVGKKWVDGELVDNPNAEWQIDDATREYLRVDIESAEDEGWSNDKLASVLADNYAFSDERAEAIARTETAFADVAGNLNAWKASGQVSQKQWIVGDGCCDECQDLDGVTVDLDDDFPDDGGDGPPLHPNCRCDVVPVLTEDS
jgi:SPP1 gp7 family putative phage head morphogenesis protein